MKIKLAVNLLLLAFIIATVGITQPVGQTESFKSTGNLARLGIKGNVVFVVSRIAPFATNNEIKIGDIITQIHLKNESASLSIQCDAFTDVETLQKTIAESPIGMAVGIEYLRMNSLTGKLESKVANVATISNQSAPNSTLGLDLYMGLMVKSVESATPQPEISASDIIFDSDLGQITNIMTFRNQVIMGKIGSVIRAKVYRVNLPLKKLEVNNIFLKTYPYPSATSNNLTLLNANKPFFTTVNNQDCALTNRCVWCCDECSPYPWSGGCRTTTCETGRTDCQPRDAGLRCSTAVCA